MSQLGRCEGEVAGETWQRKGQIIRMAIQKDYKPNSVFFLVVKEGNETLSVKGAFFYAFLKK